MRVIGIHESNADNEAGVPPTQELMEKMGKLTDGLAKAGLLLAGEGLRPSSTGVRVRFKNGKQTVTPGPFQRPHGVVAGFSIIKVDSLDEAVEWASRFADVVGDVEMDIRPVCEMWDLGFGPKPDGAKTRYMIAHKTDKVSESGTRPSKKVIAEIGKLMDEMTSAGVLLLSEGLQPTSKGKQVTYINGERTVMDGPYTESKEVIAGFAIFEVKSLDEMIDLGTDFAAVVGDVVIDCRPLCEPSDGA